MEQKYMFNSGLEKVFSIFSKEPLKIHFVKEISRRINLAHTSVKKHLEVLEEMKFVHRKKGDRFLGYLANRDNEDFLFYKRIFNLIDLKKSRIVEEIKKINHFKAIVLYGSYLRGEDVETSDVDLFVLSKSEKLPNFKKFENFLGRNFHVIIEKDLSNVSVELRNEVLNGYVIQGYLK